MQCQRKRIGSWTAAFGLGLGVALAAPAAFSDVYSWRTEDGGYAYTDDRDQVPARYADQVRVMKSGKLEDYKRFTPQDDAASARYAAHLEERLSYLRAVNAPGVQPVASPTLAAVAATPNTISLSTGSAHAPEINLAAGQGQGPIIVEPVHAKATGDSRTRRVTVIRQGGETLAVIKGPRHQFNIVDDIHDEEELEAGAALR